MPTDLEMLDRDDREAALIRGEPTRPRRQRAKVIRNAADLEEFAKQTYETGPRKFYDKMRSFASGQDRFWYVFGITDKGTQAVYGPKLSEVEALDAGRNLDRTEPFQLKTRNLASATRQIKAAMLERGKVPDTVLSPAKHIAPKKSRWLR